MVGEEGSARGRPGSQTLKLLAGSGAGQRLGPQGPGCSFSLTPTPSHPHPPHGLVSVSASGSS